MRYMMLIKIDEWAEAGQMPSPELIEAMEKYNAELIDAGAFVTAEGLQSSSKGARLMLHNGKRFRTDGPFSEAKEVIAGFWIIDVASKAEALEWAMRIPFEADTEANRAGDAGEVEVRRVFRLDDFPVNESESGWREQEAEWQEQPTIAPLDPTKKRFFCSTNGDKSTEAGEMPSEELLAAMGAYMGEQAANGIAPGGEGIRGVFRDEVDARDEETGAAGDAADEAEEIGGFEQAHFASVIKAKEEPGGEPIGSQVHHTGQDKGDKDAYVAGGGVTAP